MHGKEAFHNPVHNPKGYVANQGGRGLEGEVTLPGWGGEVQAKWFAM